MERSPWIEKTLNTVSAFASSGVGAIISEFEVSNKTLEWFVDSLVDAVLGPPPPVPQFSLDKWWGDDNYHQSDTTVYPFEIKFDENMLKDLLFRIRNRANFTRPLRGAANTYGFNSNTLDVIMDYWGRHYDFQAAEAYLNRHPHFRTNIQGLDIHFVHIKPAAACGRRVLPLLVLHGWPSNVREAYNFYPLLTEPRDGYDFVFEVVAPDLPGFGYSEGTRKQGLAPYQVAVILRNLMRRLGHRKFYVQGGDFGAITGSDMAVMFPDTVIGFHANLPYSIMPKTLLKYALGAFYPDAVVEPKYADRMYPITKYMISYLRETGYWHEQATKPDSIGVGFEDSPSALASYVLEKFVIGKNLNFQCLDDGGLPRSYRIDHLLDILMVIWSGKSITTSMRYYAETMATMEDATEAIIQIFIPSRVPYAAIKFRHEVIYQPDGLLRDKYPNLVHSRTLDWGGHFAPLESASALADHVWVAAAHFLRFHDQNK